MKEAREESKKLNQQYKDMYSNSTNKDLILELQKGIDYLSEKTLSSRDDMADLPELDFTDETTFQKAEEIMLQKEKKYDEEKHRKQREQNES